jgi:hypothetical protein
MAEDDEQPDAAPEPLRLSRPYRNGRVRPPFEEWLVTVKRGLVSEVMRFRSEEQAEAWIERQVGTKKAVRA